MLAVGWAPFWGMEHIPFARCGARRTTTPRSNILWKLRIPRVLMAFLAGTALSTSGMVFQAMFRNPLATPFTLGVSSGAALGAVVAIQFGWSFACLGLSSVSLSAFAGAVLSIGLVYLMTARSRQGSSTATMLLAGVAICFFFSSLILFLQYMSDFTRVVPHAPLDDGRAGGDIVDVPRCLAGVSLRGVRLPDRLVSDARIEPAGDRRGVRLQPRRERQSDEAAAVLRRVVDGRGGGGGLRADRIRGADGAAHLPA